MDKLIILDKKKNKLEINYKHFKAKKSQMNLILCHGFNSNLSTYGLIYEKISKKYNCYGIDLPGHGYSEGKILQMNLPFLAYSIEQFINKLNLSNIILIGHSLGAGIISYLYNNPKVLGFVFLAPFNPSIIDSELTLKDLFIPNNIQLKKTRNNLVHNLKNINKNMAKNNSIKPLPKGILRYKPYSEALTLDIWNKKRQWELLYNYLSIEKPTKIILGENDKIFPLASSYKWLKKIIKNSDIGIIKECGHSPQYEKPNEIISLILDYVNKLDAF